MPCMTCQQRFGQLDASRFIPCLRAALGMPAGGNVWGSAEHRALYDSVAVLGPVQAARGMTAAQIMAIPFGAEPEMAAGYASGYPTSMLAPDNAFWRCFGVDSTAAHDQMAAGRGPYYEAVRAASNVVAVAEGGRAEGGIPTWAWVLGGAALLGGGAYLLTR